MSSFLVVGEPPTEERMMVPLRELGAG
eukprot:SAG11_NODE_29740_length_307_cov_2.182692_1_plen_26_part_10